MPRDDQPAQQPAAARRLRDWVLSRAISFTTEKELQEALAARLWPEALLGAPITGYSRELRLDERNRIDFLVEINETIRVGVEVKIGGSLAALVRQLERYAKFPQIDQLLVITTKAQHHHIPTEINGKPVVLCSLIGDAL